MLDRYLSDTVKNKLPLTSSVQIDFKTFVELSTRERKEQKRVIYFPYENIDLESSNHRTWRNWCVIRQPSSRK